MHKSVTFCVSKTNTYDHIELSPKIGPTMEGIIGVILLSDDLKSQFDLSNLYCGLFTKTWTADLYP